MNTGSLVISKHPMIGVFATKDKIGEPQTRLTNSPKSDQICICIYTENAANSLGTAHQSYFIMPNHVGWIYSIYSLTTQVIK